MSSIEFSPALKSEISDLALNVRYWDRIEIEELSGLSVEANLNRALDISTHSHMVHDQYGRVLCMFGVAPVGSLSGGRGSPWFVGTDSIDKHRRSMLRLSLPYLAGFKKAYSQMFNAVHSENVKSIKWLERLGFQMTNVFEVGPNKSLYRAFHMGMK